MVCRSRPPQSVELTVDDFPQLFTYTLRWRNPDASQRTSVSTETCRVRFAPSLVLAKDLLNNCSHVLVPVGYEDDYNPILDGFVNHEKTVDWKATQTRSQI